MTTMSFAEGLVKQAAKWLDETPDDQVLQVVGPGLLNLFERLELTAGARRRVVRLLQLSLDHVKDRID